MQTSAEWNHKPKIEELLSITSPDKLVADQHSQWPGTNRLVLYDVCPNIHYGYIGHVACMPTELLILGATPSTAETGQNDNRDKITMRGVQPCPTGTGPNMAAGQFHTGLIDIINQHDAAKLAG